MQPRDRSLLPLFLEQFQSSWQKTDHELEMASKAQLKVFRTMQAAMDDFDASSVTGSVGVLESQGKALFETFDRTRLLVARIIVLHQCFGDAPNEVSSAKEGFMGTRTRMEKHLKGSLDLVTIVREWLPSIKVQSLVKALEAALGSFERQVHGQQVAAVDLTVPPDPNERPDIVC